MHKHDSFTLNSIILLKHLVRNELPDLKQFHVTFSSSGDAGGCVSLYVYSYSHLTARKEKPEYTVHVHMLHTVQEVSDEASDSTRQKP